MKKIYTVLLFTLVIGLGNIYSATFTSVSSGTWSTPATWSRVGADADGIPDADDDVTISAPHTISLSLANNYVRNLVNNGTFNCLSKNLHVYANFTNNNKVTSIVLFVEGNCVYTSSVTTNGITSILVYGNLTIAANTTLVSPNSLTVANGKIINNFGNLTINVNLALQGTSQFNNRNNAVLSISGIVSGTGSLLASSTGNTVIYKNSSTSIQVKSATYYNLVLNSSPSTRVATGNIIVLNDFTLSTITAGTNNIFNLSNFSLTTSGNWFNNANRTITNQGVITFNGSGTQTINRTTGNEVITNMVMGGTGTVQLNRNLDVTQNLTINSGIFNVTASNFTVSVGGNLTNNSAINVNQGVFNFNGSSAQTISGTTNTNFFNVTSANTSGGVSVTSAISISNLLRVNSGSFGTSGGGVITIPATGPTTYGRIASVGGSLTGTGWLLQSYIDGPAPKGWQWLSSPINGNTLADWDNDPRFYMSGVGGNDGSAGTFRSVRTYNEVTGTYANVITTSTPLTRGKGFQVWMADDNITGLTSPLVYNSIGTPNFGNVTFPVTAGGSGSGYNLVGNPYACPITYSAVVAASGNLFSSFIILLENGSYSTDPNGGIISPNQGFMCCAFSSGNIVFPEASKNIVTSPNILRTAPVTDAIAVNVYNNINGLGGTTYITFKDNASDIFEPSQDLSFLSSPNDDADNIWTKTTDQVSMLRNALSSDGEAKSVPLTVKSGVYGTHHISFKGLTNFNKYSSVVLEDLTSGKKTNLLEKQDYTFEAEEIDKEYNFIIHFSNEKTTLVKETVSTNLLNENTSVYNTSSDVVVKFDMSESTPVKISVYSLTGQQVIEPLNLNVTNDRITLPLQKDNGLYLLIIQSKDQQITRKIIY